MELFIHKIKKIFFSIFLFINRKIISPNLNNEDARRKELILNLLVLSLLILSITGFFLVLFVQIAKKSNYTGVGLFEITLVCLFLFILLYLSRRGHVLISSYLLVLSHLIFSTYFGYLWGIDLPSTLLSYMMIIVMSSLLINTRFGLFIASTVAVLITSFYYIEAFKIYTPDHSWKKMDYKIDDAIEYIVILFITAGIASISNREIEKALIRARASEKNLKLERDKLEIRVLEKTNELKKAQLEKISNMYRFVEFGRLSSGLFHDLMTPLTSISIALDKFEKNTLINDITNQTEIAIKSGKKINELLTQARKQIQIPKDEIMFNIKNEINSVLNFLSSKLRRLNVEIILQCPSSVFLFGNPIIFNHIATNLVSNAIDAYEKNTGRDKKIIISVLEKNLQIIFKVTDFGCGITTENISHIFEPFFTTKESARGLGVGLSATKHAVEKYFKGTISVISEINKNTTFTIKIPKTIH